MLRFTRGLPRLYALLFVTVVVSSLHADTTLNALYWADASTSATGIYNSESPGATPSGNYVVGMIPTDANQNSPDNDVVNYFRTLSNLSGASTAYNDVLLGDLSLVTSLSVTFNLFDSALPLGDPFPASALVGETYTGESGSNAGIRLMFMGGYYSDPLYGNTPNEWWSNPAAAYVTSMDNGQNVTLTVPFDPSMWSNYYGHVGTDSAATEIQFYDALTGVSRLGLSFGSGYFFSDGFAFNTGGTAQIEIEGISVTSSRVAPEPGTFVLFGGAFCVLALLRRRLRS